MLHQLPVRFNRPAVVGEEIGYIEQAVASGRLAGDGEFGRRCEAILKEYLSCERTMLTPSCTAALELAALLLELQPGDEVILPSYTFVSTANAFVLCGATPVFIDVDPETMNMDAALIEAAITPRSKAIVPVHYAGVPCDMKAIMTIAERHRLVVIEDAAQALGSSLADKKAGSFGQLSAFSFHETKNLTAGGEGGALVINDPRYIARAEILREKGTDREQFFRGEVDKYSWVDVGSSYLPSEIQAAYLLAQLENIEHITANRKRIWDFYFDQVTQLAEQFDIEVMPAPPPGSGNAHMFFLKCRDLAMRSELLQCLHQREVLAVFHYVPLHNSLFGQRVGRFVGEDRYTSRESARLIRLPLWLGMPQETLDYVIASLRASLQEVT